VGDRALRRRIVSALALGAGGGLLASARADDPEGPPVTVEHRPAGSFTALRISIPADVEVHPAPAAFVRVTASRRVVDAVRVTSGSDVLDVGSARPFRTRAPLRVEIGYRSLRSAELTAPGDLRIEGLRSGEFDLRVRGAGDVRLVGLNLETLRVDSEGSASVVAEGAASSQRVVLRGTSTYEGAQVRSRRTTAELEGASEAEVTAAELLRATVSGASTVRYRGDPKVETRLAGTATVERM
jgi:hypothetical protein